MERMCVPEKNDLPGGRSTGHLGSATSTAIWYDESTDSELSSSIPDLLFWCEKFCWNGTCVEEQCTCEPNYKLHRDEGDDGRLLCLPICETECINGYCLFPGMCACFDGAEPAAGYLCQHPDGSGTGEQSYGQMSGKNRLKWLFIAIGIVAVVLSIVIAFLMCYIYKKRSYRVDKNEKQFGVYFSANKVDVIRA
ncbi:GL23616 [Drosophila persimilis]|uniref:GL23616 n=1 Tax=Drosophila persimilis TaxID=7234 RepID=B4G2F6_DROPE|nr:GL23616 [Drosophila persimilis]